MYRIFVVEDDRTIAQEVCRLAESWGLEARCARDLRAVTEEAAAFAPHLIILDIALPCFDGYHWCRELRKQTNAPILFLSSASDNMNVIMAMNFGGDDFIAKPFDGGVLMAKVQAMLRRSYDLSAPAVLRERRGAQLSADDQKLTYQGQTVELTKNEYRILACLMESAGKVVSREKLMQRLWETDSFVDENTLTVNVNRLRRQLDAAETRRGETVAYYTAWVHQIKTPIAAMRLTLQGEDTPAARRLTAELGRIEQYVDMALTYLRLEEGGSDYVIRPCSVDEVVRAAVRRFAGEFIDRRIRLDYEPVQWETVTDGKWLTFVVEQLLSNALKYTGQEGAIRIYRQGDELCIADTGMGIAPEDLPRVFQMGYTGQNGRLDRRSSGIGLYLCRRICGNLRHGIRMESVPGKGTTVYLTLGRGDFLPE